MSPPTKRSRPPRLTLERKFALRSKICGIVSCATRPPRSGVSQRSPRSIGRERCVPCVVKRPTRGCTTVVKKGSSSGPRISGGRYCTLQSDFLIASMSDRKYRQRGYQDDALRAPKKSAARPACARARRARGRPAHLPGWAKEHQHAGLPRSLSLLAVRLRGVARGRRPRASACAAASICARAPSACRSIPAAASSACSRCRRASARRTRETPARASVLARRSSARPRRPKWTARARRSTISSSSDEFALRSRPSDGADAPGRADP